MAAHSNLLAVSGDRAQVGVPVHAERPRLRFAVAGAVLAAEVCAVAALGHPWIPVGQSMAAPIVLIAALIFFGRTRLQPRRFAAHPVSLPMMGVHTLAASTVLFCGLALLHGTASGEVALRLTLAAGWLLSLVVMLGSLPIVLAPPREWFALGRRLGVTWVYAMACVAPAMAARRLEQLAWDAPDSRLGQAMAAAAFAGVRLVLPLICDDVSADAATRVIGVGGFRIHVAGACSGIEGITLMLFFTLGWLLVERRHLRLPRAIWLAPVALMLMWCLNVLRMTTLIALGAAGQPKMAVKGFHTEAGWITFTLVAVGFLAAANRLPWLRRERVERRARRTADVDPDVLYLLPMVTMLAASLLTQAFSDGFDSLYPAGFALTGAVLLALRKPLAGMPWRAGWTDAAAGLGVGAVWVWCTHGGDAAALRDGLGGLPHAARAVWLASRVLAGVVTIPLAEELAYRGFLARRLATVRRFRIAEFEVLPYRGIGWLGVFYSALAFGVMHGHRWLPAAIAGVVFAALARRRDSLGAAVLAHGAAGAVIATWALVTHDLSVW